MKKGIIIGIIIGGLVFGSIGVLASGLLASSVTYSPADTNWQGINTVEKALNSLQSDYKNQLISLNNQIDDLNSYAKCKTGYVDLNNSVATSSGQVIESYFAPTSFATVIEGINEVSYYDKNINANKYFENSKEIDFSPYWSITGNSLIARNWAVDRQVGHRLHYIVCK